MVIPIDNSSPRWVEVRCGHIRAGSEKPCGRQLVFVAVSPERPTEVLGMTGVDTVRSVSQRHDFPELPPPPALMRDRQTAVRSGGGGSWPRYEMGPRMGRREDGSLSMQWEYRDTFNLSCHPKRCGKVHQRREDKLAALALAELSAGRSTLFLF